MSQTPQVISFNYKLTDSAGQQLDASQPGHPLIFLAGAGQIIPGLEETLVGMETGQQKTVTVPAAEAYGDYNDKLIYKVKASQLPKADVQVGDMFEVGGGDQYSPVKVTQVNGEDITLDGNHPLAGQDLTFFVEIVQKRDATQEEITHGHVHGTGGCQH